MPSPNGYVVGYCHPGEVRAEFHESLLNLQSYDQAGYRRLRGRIGWQSSANVSMARNAIVRKFLDDSDAPWLLMLDADMVFEPDAPDRLLARAKESGGKVLGGLCFGVESGRLFPTMYDLAGTESEPAVVRYQSWPAGSLFPVFATGAAFLLMHRDALEAVRDKGFSRIFPWFEETVYPPGPDALMPMGEDVTFCLRAQICGFGVAVDTAVQVGHVKAYTLTAAMYEAQQQREADGGSGS